ncbi:MAG: hypothetical protein Q7J07_05825 [Pelolinea sp.]|nr:hypothetical protein [Pelolinea sp.]
MKLRQYSRFFFPALVLIFCIFIYGLFTPFLGFYWDDLPYTWFKVANGVQGTVRAIALDRPILSLFYAVTMTLFGEKPFAWQIFAIIARWLFTLSVYSFLQSFWPKREKINQAITLLVLVFPGFTQQWISVIYSHAFLVLSLYFLSLTIFIKNLRSESQSIVKSISAAILAFICMGAMEYVVGLEFLRPLLIFLIEKQFDGKKSFIEILKVTIRKWLPYYTGLFLFVIYRIFLASSVLYRVQKIGGFITSPLSTIFELFGSQTKNIYISIFPVWGAIFTPFSNINFSSSYGKIHLAFLGILLAFSALFIILQKEKIITTQADPIERVHWIKEVIPLSFCILFFSGIPFWAANLIPGIEFPNDRFLLPFILGSTLVVFFALEFTLKKKWIWSVLFCTLFSLSGAYQLYNANIYRNEWDKFTQFFQQLSWRIPAITENTIFVTDELPFTYYTDNSLTAAINWLYAQDDLAGSLPYMLNYTNNRLGTSLPSLNPGTSIHQNYRTFAFNGSTNQMVIFYHQPPGCVHIADPLLDHLNPLISPILREVVKNSNSDLIKQSGNKNKVFFVEDKAAESWCYYYQKASLAYQNQNWDEIARLGDLAFNIDDYPNDASERIPFIFGYAQTGKFEKAVQVTQTTHQISPLYQPMLCETWKIIEESMQDNFSGKEPFSFIEDQLDCDQIKQ